MTDQPILVEQRAGYRVITLNRPDRLNAFNDAMHAALKAAIADAVVYSARAILNKYTPSRAARTGARTEASGLPGLTSQ